FYQLRHPASAYRKYPPRYVQRRFAAYVHRVDGDHTDEPSSSPHKSAGHRHPGSEAPKAKTAGNPHPSETGFKDPTAEVIGSPAPGLVAHKAQDKNRIDDPAAAVDGAPAEA